MILVGYMDSPFVRRVAVTMQHYGMPYERNVISVFRDADAVRAINPLGMVPSLTVDDGETIFDSRAILDYLDETMGQNALMPASGSERRNIQKITAIALGAVEKAVYLVYEKRNRNPDKIDPAMVERFEGQVHSGLGWLEDRAPAPWLAGNMMTHADVTAAIAVTFVINKHPHMFKPADYPKISALRDMAEALPAFQAAPFLEE
ncbi:MAG: glutathione S-transferase family protein [Rhodospirillales bacterium]